MTRNIITTVNRKSWWVCERWCILALLEKKRWNDAATIGPLSRWQPVDRDGENDNIGLPECNKAAENETFCQNIQTLQSLFCLFVCLFTAWSLLTTNQGLSLSLFLFFVCSREFIRYWNEIWKPDYWSGLYNYIKTSVLTDCQPTSIYAYESVCSWVRI